MGGENIDERPGWLTDSVCYALYKPRGMLTSNKLNPRARVEHRRGCMGAWGKEVSAEVGGTRVFHVGRLDKKTSGLIFLTSVGYFGRFICTPGMLSKEYIATTERPATEAQMQMMRDGFELHDGFAKAVEVELLDVKRETRVVTKANVRKNPKEKKARAQRKKERQQQQQQQQQPQDAVETSTTAAAAAATATTAVGKRKFDEITPAPTPTVTAEDATKGAAATPLVGSGSAAGEPTVGDASTAAPGEAPSTTAAADGAAGGDDDFDDDDEPVTVEKVTCRVRMVLDIGRNHIVKRMMHHVGLPVTSLHRTAIGPVSLDSLGLTEPGVHKRLSPEDLEQLWGARKRGRRVIESDEEGEDEN